MHVEGNKRSPALWMGQIPPPPRKKDSSESRAEAEIKGYEQNIMLRFRRTDVESPLVSFFFFKVTNSHLPGEPKNPHLKTRPAFTHGLPSPRRDPGR